VIPLTTIESGVLYSHHDAEFLLGAGFSKRAAQEVIKEACRTGNLDARTWRRRWWFSGDAYIAWVQWWFGSDIGTSEGRTDNQLAPAPKLVNDDRVNSEPVAKRRKGGGR
jgi:hypothetical protein